MRQGDDAPLDLGVVGTADEPATDEPGEPPPGSGRWRWAVPAATFAVGGALGLVVADTRDDAAGYADVRLVSGAIHGLSDRHDEDSPGRIELSILNLGEHEVEILGLEPAGMTVHPDTEPADPVAAPPGEWVTALQDGLVADCDAQAGDGLRIRVRDVGGTVRVVEADGLPDVSGVGGVWQHACRPPDLLFPAIAATVTASDAGSVTTEVRLSNPSTEPLEVIELASEAPGLAATVADLPFVLSPDESLGVPMTWTVTDCRLARQWHDPQFVYAFAGNQPSRGNHPVDAAAQAALVLLVDRVCGDTP
ncbi:hypothetical protein [Jiangella rhizosphaerae]|uniref:DUF4232 domain-containing protein n=1 Tax=Jiangella rhizosphaerae TaxID=2293569 RepID=A0A418KNR7_9ACTN|nr:hypothetical protein [Jiangella rhizosphaerae]RIQ20807.1 hypothetical protein DY240_16525 [Jiangella rhizosphaerae]